MGTRSIQGARHLACKKHSPFDPGQIGEYLPAAYRKFWHEWKEQERAPVHYIPEPGKWKRNPATGEVKPVQNIPIRPKFPKESHSHLWGGEGVVVGFQKRSPTTRRVPHFWVPQLKQTTVYSEILNQFMSVVVTQRTIELIHSNMGFDHYILKTPACDLQSTLAVQLKRRLLLALHEKSLYTDDPERQNEVYNKYQHYLEPYTEDELNWYGLPLMAAVKKQAQQEEEKSQPVPLKELYRLELIEMLLEKKASGESLPETGEAAKETSSWLKKLNPFAGKNENPSTKS